MTSKTAMIIIAALILLGLAVLGISLAGGGERPSCPPGTVWSAAHQHCH